jgi:SAM-dependent methyltransferase
MSVLSAVCPTLVLDYRPLRVKLSGLTPIAGSITCLPFADKSLPSISCLHVIEHIGLGRYGDPLDPKGSFRAALELVRVLAPGGKLYLSVPVGRERVCFNAHRVFSASTVMAWFADLQITNFSLVRDDGTFLECASATAADDLEYGCGVFEFTRSHAGGFTRCLYGESAHTL